MEVTNKLNSIYVKLSSALEENKKEFSKDIKELDSLLCLFFEQRKFKIGNLDEKSKNMITSIKKEAEDLSKRLELVEKEKAFAISEGCHICYQNLSKFPFGYIKSFHLNKFGSFEISFGCIIRDEKVRKFLESEGLEFIKDSLIANDNNLNLIKEILIREFKATKVEISERKYNKDTTFKISQISFEAKPINLISYSFETNQTELNFRDSSKLTLNEIIELKDEIKCLYEAYLSSNDESLVKAHHDCFQIIEFSFCRICKIFDIETSISKIHNQVWLEIKEIDKENTKKRETLASYISTSTLQDCFCKLVNRLESHFMKEYGFFLKELFINQYGVIKAVLSYNLDVYEDTCLSDDKLKQIYDSIGDSSEDYNLFILSNDKNFKVLEDKIKEDFKNSEIISIQTKRDFNNSELIINAFELDLELEDFIGAT